MSNLTDLTVAKLPVPEKGQALYADGLVKGLYVRVSQGGSKTFVLVQGKERRFQTLGRYGDIKLAEARAAARKLRAERTLGRILPASMSVEHARTEYLEQITVRGNTREYYERHLNKLTGQLVNITPRDINYLLDSLPRPSAIQALASFRAFFKWCIRRYYMDVSPCERIQAQQSTSRSRVLSDDELKSIWKVCSGETSTFNSIVMLLLLTGQRRGEIAALQHSWIENDAITLPSDITKNGRQHQFPICEMSKSILISRMPSGSSKPAKYLFPARGKTDTCFNGWSKSKAALDEASGVNHWTLHDLRRTFATRLAEMAVAPHVIERLLNHVSGTISGVSAVYNRATYIKEMRQAVATWEAHLSKIL